MVWKLCSEILFLNLNLAVLCNMWHKANNIVLLFKKKNTFLLVLVCFGATIRTHWEIQCLLYEWFYSQSDFILSFIISNSPENMFTPHIILIEHYYPILVNIDSISSIGRSFLIHELTIPSLTTSCCYNGLLPERQSHGHGASCFIWGALTSERLRENRQEQTCLLSSETDVA